jgi:hypothetical protein
VHRPRSGIVSHVAGDALRRASPMLLAQTGKQISAVLWTWVCGSAAWMLTEPRAARSRVTRGLFSPGRRTS